MLDLARPEALQVPARPDGAARRHPDHLRRRSPQARRLLGSAAPRHRGSRRAPGARRRSDRRDRQRARVRAHRRQHRSRSRRPGIELPAGSVFGASPAIREVLALVRRIAPSRCNVLVLGERGTGRESVARAVHGQSPRRDKPFVKIDCAGVNAVRIVARLSARARAGHAPSISTR